MTKAEAFIVSRSPALLKRCGTAAGQERILKVLDKNLTGPVSKGTVTREGLLIFNADSKDAETARYRVRKRRRLQKRLDAAKDPVKRSRLKRAMERDARTARTDKDTGWITLENGNHVYINEGTVTTGANGSLTGKTLSSAESGPSFSETENSSSSGSGSSSTSGSSKSGSTSSKSGSGSSSKSSVTSLTNSSNSSNEWLEKYLETAQKYNSSLEDNDHDWVVYDPDDEPSDSPFEGVSLYGPDTVTGPMYGGNGDRVQAALFKSDKEYDRLLKEYEERTGKKPDEATRKAMFKDSLRYGEAYIEKYDELRAQQAAGETDLSYDDIDRMADEYARGSSFTLNGITAYTIGEETSPTSDDPTSYWPYDESSDDPFEDIRVSEGSFEPYKTPNGMPQEEIDLLSETEAGRKLLADPFMGYDQETGKLYRQLIGGSPTVYGTPEELAKKFAEQEAENKNTLQPLETYSEIKNGSGSSNIPTILYNAGSGSGEWTGSSSDLVKSLSEFNSSNSNGTQMMFDMETGEIVAQSSVGKTVSLGEFGIDYDTGDITISNVADPETMSSAISQLSNDTESSGAAGESSSESGGTMESSINQKFLGNDVPSGTAAENNNVLGEGYSQGAQDAYDQARANEPQISSDMCEIAESLGLQMYGLPFSVKTASSVVDKIQRKQEEDPTKTDEEIVSGMSDLVRYTVIGEHDSLVDTTNEVVDALEEAGYTVTKLENKYLEGKDYKGIHLDVVSPTGQKFEYQIHSTESQTLKDALHPLYEEERSVSTSASRKAELKAQMTAMSSKLPSPKNIASLKNFAK